MTKYEMWALIISIVAIIAASVSPFITYYLLDPQVQAFRNRGILKVTESEPIISTKIISSTPPGTKPPITVATTTWGMDIENVGSLPAKDVLIVFRYEPLSVAPSPESDYSASGRPKELKVEFDPPMVNEITPTGENEFEISLNRAIAPGGTLHVQTPYSPDVVWVSNEFNETNVIRSSLGAYRHLQRLSEEGKLPKDYHLPIIDAVK